MEISTSRALLLNQNHPLRTIGALHQREQAWIGSTRHVLDEALDKSHPLLERVKFLAIYANNLDEFFIVGSRVSSAPDLQKAC